MTETQELGDVARFRGLLADRLGWTFADADTAHLTSVLDRRAALLDVDRAGYLQHLDDGDRPRELSALAEELTISETYFFRYADQFRALADVALPARLPARADERLLRLLSVGCSSGEEAYTLAITAREVQPDPAWQITVLGLDANPAMLRRARTARYSTWSLRETPDTVRRRWFRPRNDTFEVDPGLREMVEFRRYNVVDDDPLWRTGHYDVVFCRNLLMYLTPQVAEVLVERMTRALAPGGHLFLGHTDTLGSRPDGLEPQHSHSTFYYRRSCPVAPAVPTAAIPYRTADPTPAPPSAAGRTSPGHSATQRSTSERSASERTASGRTAESGQGQREAAGAAATRPAWLGRTAGAEPVVRQRALSLLRDEQFAAALGVVEDGMPAAPQPRDLLLHGVLLAQTGRLEGAEIVARRLLDGDGLYADAHHLLAVCLEGGAATEVAVGHYRLAAHLDATFAMPRLRLGLLARRRGDHRAAGTELASALGLLVREPEERIALFGGGFGRISLVALCRAELDACGVHR